MFDIICKDSNLTYNAYHIAKAFYPTEEIKLQVREEASDFVLMKKDGDVIAKVSYNEKSVLKHEIDCLLYKKLSAITGKELPWGILTGVRPTKIAMEKTMAGMNKDDFVKWIGNELFVSKEKAVLSWNIVKREKEILDKIDAGNGFSLYIGIPFCPTICDYCSFGSGSLDKWGSFVDDYLRVLIKEIKAVGNLVGKKNLQTIYIGGGTPTTLSTKQLELLSSAIEKSFKCGSLLEYTLEAGRSDTITKEKLEVIKRHGITRISINPQTMQQRTLDLVGRQTPIESIVRAFHQARDLGFDNINMDLIAGLPLETAEDMRDTLQQIMVLNPDSLTVHALARKRASNYGRSNDGMANNVTNKYSANGEIEKMLELSKNAADAIKMEPYYLYRQKDIAGNFENIGFAKIDKAGIYNILIMEEIQSIIALGAGATSKIVLPKPISVGNGKTSRYIRSTNDKSIDGYIRRVDEMIQRKEELLCLW